MLTASTMMTVDSFESQLAVKSACRTVSFDWKFDARGKLLSGHALLLVDINSKKKYTCVQLIALFHFY